MRALWWQPQVEGDAPKTGTPALSGFWLKAMQNHPAFEDFIQEPASARAELRCAARPHAPATTPVAHRTSPALSLRRPRPTPGANPLAGIGAERRPLRCRARAAPAYPAAHTLSVAL